MPKQDKENLRSYKNIRTGKNVRLSPDEYNKRRDGELQPFSTWYQNQLVDQEGRPLTGDALKQANEDIENGIRNVPTYQQWYLQQKKTPVNQINRKRNYTKRPYSSRHDYSWLKEERSESKEDSSTFKFFKAGVAKKLNMMTYAEKTSAFAAPNTPPQENDMTPLINKFMRFGKTILMFSSTNNNAFPAKINRDPPSQKLGKK